jgi:hypothetical protein
MKHILNNLSNEEKNSIREQHTGGMKVMTENFSKLLNSKLGDSKPLVEQVSKPVSPRRDGKPTQTNPPMNGSKQPRQGVADNQYRKPPYCEIGKSQGTVVKAQTGTSGPDTSLGETGLALSVNGKVVCLISTKYQQGGYVTKKTS